MSRNNSQILEERRERMLHVIQKEFSSNAEFCREMDLSHNWVNYYKSAEDPPAIHDGILSSLYETKKVSPLWIINGVGPYKFVRYTKDYEPSRAAEPGDDTAADINYALNLIDEIEQAPNEIKDIELPPDIEIRISRLLTRLLERRIDRNNT